MIELHIIQSFPVTCLNRDDLGSPKSAVFGGVQRARVSSQCWKRAIRFLAKESQEGLFGGNRTKYFAATLAKEFDKKVNDAEKSKTLALKVADYIGKLDEKGDMKAKTLCYFSTLELSKIVENITQTDYEKLLTSNQSSDPESGKKKKKDDGAPIIKAALKGINTARDIADIALFGRMVADDHSLMMEGAANFSHAISTHKVSNEIDFFSAVDDLKPQDSEGAGHIGTLEFNSACYYRYIGINLDLLKDEGHLKHFSDDEIRKVLEAFIKASLQANPVARKNSQFGYSYPSFVLGLKRSGQPLSLANAFETPVKSSDGYTSKSVEKLKEHLNFMKKTWDITFKVEVEIPTIKMDEFIKELLQ